MEFVLGTLTELALRADLQEVAWRMSHDKGFFQPVMTGRKTLRQETIQATGPLFSRLPFSFGKTIHSVPQL